MSLKLAKKKVCHLHNERGKCLPDVSLYKKICEILDISLNEFFAGEKIADKDYKKIADNNLFAALENSVFTLKDKVDYFKRKWQKEHAFELTIEMLILLFFIIYGLIKEHDIVFVTIIIGFIWSIIVNNRMMAYIENNAYGKKSDITVEEFRASIKRFKEAKEILNKFDSREKAIAFLVKETKLSEKECQEAYDIIIKLNIKDDII